MRTQHCSESASTVLAPLFVDHVRGPCPAAVLLADRERSVGTASETADVKTYGGEVSMRAIEHAAACAGQPRLRMPTWGGWREHESRVHRDFGVDGGMDAAVSLL